MSSLTRSQVAQLQKKKKAKKTPAAGAETPKEDSTEGAEAPAEAEPTNDAPAETPQTDAPAETDKQEEPADPEPATSPPVGVWGVTRGPDIYRSLGPHNFGTSTDSQPSKGFRR